MTASLRIAGAQIDLTVGDLDGNEQKILAAMAWAEEQRADVLLLPELAVTGYPPEDLVLRDGFVADNLAVVERLATASGSTAVVVGFVDRLDQGVLDDDAVERDLANAAAVIAGGELKGVYHKELLPNYGVFDEARYFAESRDPLRLWTIAGTTVGVSVCEDIWSPEGPPSEQANGGAAVLLNINGSPYHLGRGAERETLLRDEAMRSGAVVAYVNTVGGQDELVFDGDSMVFAPDGTLLFRAGQFTEELFVVDVPIPAPRKTSVEPIRVSEGRDRYGGGEEPIVAGSFDPQRLGEDAEIYTALITGLRDYVGKNGFSEVVVGLSGGIDSALAATIAVDSLGADMVHGITMPSRYSSEGSVSDSRILAENLGIRFDVVPIEPVFAAFLDTLDPLFEGTGHDVAEENLQARIRGTTLMAVSNKFGGMVVATGNKSEMAVGYATLYGDMVGGYAVLKDVYKTIVYRLAEWRNKQGEVIPSAIIDKAPSAELRPGQLDTDSLPPYEILDPILMRYIEEDATPEEIVAEGFDPDLVYRVARLVDRNEYKRRQAAPGVRITKKGFGRDRRLPITNHYLF
jgi:NAD+ synthase (glutamine-hydrolysing)